MSKLNIKTTKDLDRMRELTKKWIAYNKGYEPVFDCPLDCSEQRELAEFIETLIKDKIRDDLLRCLWSW